MGVKAVVIEISGAIIGLFMRGLGMDPNSRRCEPPVGLGHIHGEENNHRMPEHGWL